jgi:hypothetical protein
MITKRKSNTWWEKPDKPHARLMAAARLACAIACTVTLTLALALLLACPASARPAAAPSASTLVSGVITSDTVWTLAGSPYQLTDHVIVAQGVTLTIQAGVVVSGTTDRGIKVDGRLIAIGASNQPITFTSQAGTGGGQWDGLAFRPGSSGILRHGVLRYGGTYNGSAIASLSVDGATGLVLEHFIICDGAAPGDVSHGLALLGGAVLSSSALTITGHSGAGVRVENATLTLAASQVADNVTGVSLGAGAVVTLTGNTIQGNTVYGLDAQSVTGEMNLSGNAFVNNATSMRLWAQMARPDTFTANSFSGANAAIEFVGGALEEDTTWPAFAGHVYKLSNHLSVPAGRTLTIQPGVTVQIAADRGLKVDGSLSSLGTAGRPITFTSTADTGGGQWDGLLFRAGSQGNLAHTVVRYGGAYNGVAYGQITADAATLALSHVRILDGAAPDAASHGLTVLGNAVVSAQTITVSGHSGAGVRVENASLTLAASQAASNTTGVSLGTGAVVTLTGNTIQGHSDCGLDVQSVAAAMSLSGNSFASNTTSLRLWAENLGADTLTANSYSGTDASIEFRGGALLQDATLPAAAGHTYRLSDHVSVPAGRRLTVQAGATVAAAADRGLKVYGELVTLGAASSPITFTSVANNAAGAWDGLIFHPGSRGVLTHTTIRYAGAWDGLASSGLTLSGASVTLDHSLVFSSTAAGGPSHGLAVLNGSTLTLTESIISNHSGDGVNLVESRLVAQGATWRENALSGVYAQDSAVIVAGGIFIGNGAYGLYHINPNAIPFGLSGNTFSGNGAADLRLRADDLGPTILTGNTFAGAPSIVALDGGGFDEDITLSPLPNLRVQIAESVAVRSGIAVTLTPGMALYGATDRGLRVNGRLTAVGTASQPITLTSVSDSAAGQWDGLTFREGSRGELAYVTLRYAGAWDGLAHSALTLYNIADVAIRNSEILTSSAAGVVITGTAGRLLVEDVTIGGHSSHGVSVWAGSPITFTRAAIRNNGGDGIYAARGRALFLENEINNNAGAGLRGAGGYSLVYASHIHDNTGGGIYAATAPLPQVHNSRIAANAAPAVRNDSAATLDVRFNWWGQSPPPDGTFSQNPGVILADGWLTSDAVFPYTLASPDWAPDPYESNEVIGAAKALPGLNSPADAWIFPHADKDVYSVTLTQAGPLGATLDSQGSRMTPALAVLNSAGVTLTQGTAAMGGRAAVTTSVQAGTYYLVSRDALGREAPLEPYALYAWQAGPEVVTAIAQARPATILQGGQQYSLGIYTYTLAAGQSTSIPVRVPFTLTTPGLYFAVGETWSALGQLLDDDRTPFTEMEGTLALLLTRDKSVYKPGQTIAINGEVRNLGGTAINDSLQLKADSSVFYSQTITAPANGSYFFTSSIQATTPFSLTGSFHGITVTDQVNVMSPVVSMTLAAPEAALPGVITAELLVANNGGVPADLTLDFQGQVQPVSLAVGASLLLTRSLEITRDLTVQATLSGEATQTVTRTVRYSAPPMLTVAPAARYAEGEVVIPYTLTNPGLLDLTVDATFDLGGPQIANRKSQITNRATAFSQALAGQTVARSHPLPQGSAISDTLTYGLTKGTYSLASSTAWQSGQAAFQVRAVDDLTLAAQIAAAPGVSPTLTALITNVGYNAFTGTLRVVGAGSAGPFFQGEQAVALAVDAAQSYVTAVDTAGLAPGVYTATASLLAPDQRIIATAAATWPIRGADFVVTERPMADTLATGETYTFTFSVENRGDLGDNAIFRFALGDVTNQQQAQRLEVGERGRFTFTFTLPDELASSTYVATYEVSGALGATVARGEWRIVVQGIDLTVQASTDKPLYEEGEIALVTLNVANMGGRAAPELYALVSFNGVTQTQSFSLTASGQGAGVRRQQAANRQSAIANLKFPVAVTFTGDRKVFYGVFDRESDRSIHFNTLYLHQRQPAVTVLTDKEVYIPGEMVQATVVTTATGELHVVAPDYQAVIPLNGSNAAFGFALPGVMTRGTYAIYYTLMGCGCPEEGREQTAWFDVDAADAEMIAVALDQPRYAPGDALTATLTVAANQEMDALLRSWIRYPDGSDGAASQQTVHLLAIPNNPITVTATITDTQMGIHRLLYSVSGVGLRNTRTFGAGLSAPEADGAVIYTYGLAAFDVGGGGLISLGTDKNEYGALNEPVIASIQLYASWPETGTLTLILDTGVVQSQPVNLSAGFQTLKVALAGPVAPGRRTLTAVFQADGYRTDGSVGFAYGTALPNLRPSTPGLTGSGVLTRTLTIFVVNEGQSAATATTARFYDGHPAQGGALLAAVGVPPLAAGEQAALATVWNIQGQGGPHTLYVVVDPVVEFDVSNNQAQADVTLPRLDSGLTVTPASLIAGQSATLDVRLTNLQAAAALSATASVRVRSPQGALVYSREWAVTLADGEERILSAVWNVPADAAPGLYAATQEAQDDYGMRQFTSRGIRVDASAAPRHVYLPLITRDYRSPVGKPFLYLPLVLR